MIHRFCRSSLVHSHVLIWSEVSGLAAWVLAGTFPANSDGLASLPAANLLLYQCPANGSGQPWYLPWLLFSSEALSILGFLRWFYAKNCKKRKRYGLKLNSETIIISIKSKMDAVLWMEGLSESRHNWDPKSLKRGFKLLLITNNDSKVQAKHSLWVIIMVVPCVVIADCKTSSCLHLWKQAGWFIKRGGQKKGWCVIQLVDSDKVTIISNAFSQHFRQQSKQLLFPFIPVSNAHFWFIVCVMLKARIWKVFWNAPKARYDVSTSTSCCVLK